jgi:hypothetical protein
MDAATRSRNDRRSVQQQRGRAFHAVGYEATGTRRAGRDCGCSAARNCTRRHSETYGDVTYTSETYRVTAVFNGSSASGTIRLQDGVTYGGTAYMCDTGEVAWTATKVS